MKKQTYDPHANCYTYKVKNKNGILAPYSGSFKSIAEAEKWYNRHGIDLEQYKQFKNKS